MASFEMAANDGADAIETDVHVTQDGILVLFHDSALGRTTDGSGKIADQVYHGGIDRVRTTQQPSQKIPTLGELCQLLMRPQYRHLQANLDIKPDNDPNRLFQLMARVVAQHDDGHGSLAPRLILGLWHPKFLQPAAEHVPALRRIHIGGSPALAREYFWDACDGFSMYFPSLVPVAGQQFLRDAQSAGKDVMVWTVNREDEMVEAARWGVAAVLTDRTDVFNALRRELHTDWYGTVRKHVGPAFRWTTWRYYTPALTRVQAAWHAETVGLAGESFGRSQSTPRATALEDTVVVPPSVAKLLEDTGPANAHVQSVGA